MCGQQAPAIYLLFSPLGSFWEDQLTGGRSRMIVNMWHTVHMCKRRHTHPGSAGRQSRVVSNYQQMWVLWRFQVSESNLLHAWTEPTCKRQGRGWWSVETYLDIPLEQRCGTADLLIPAATQRTGKDFCGSSNLLPSQIVLLVFLATCRLI